MVIKLAGHLRKCLDVHSTVLRNIMNAQIIAVNLKLIFIITLKIMKTIQIICSILKFMSYIDFDSFWTRVLRSDRNC